MKQLYIILCIIGVGSISSVAYAASTIITDTSITTTDLTVTGTCTGCAAGEADFTNYNIIALNSTVITGASNSIFGQLAISNNGNTAYVSSTYNTFVNLAGVTKFLNFTGVSSFKSQQLDQSRTGEYLVIFNDNTPSISIFKNGVYLQDLGWKSSEFTTPSLGSHISIGISPDGKYIGVVGLDIGGVDDRLVIFEGS